MKNSVRFTRSETGEQAAPSPSVLVVAENCPRRDAVARHLENRGYRVVIAESTQSALAIARSGSVDMVIASPKLLDADEYDFARRMQTTLPGLPMLLLSNDSEFGVQNATAALPPETACAVGLSNITPREREVLDLIISGHKTKAVARCLAISPRTVEHYRAQLLRKSNARSTADLVRIALTGLAA